MSGYFEFTRNKEAERLMRRQGLNNCRLFKCVMDWVHYVIMVDNKSKPPLITASYQLNPALTGGKIKTWHIDHDAMPTIVSPNQPKPLPNYATEADARKACIHTHQLLKQKLGL